MDALLAKLVAKNKLNTMRLSQRLEAVTMAKVILKATYANAVVQSQKKVPKAKFAKLVPNAKAKGHVAANNSRH